MQGHHAWLTPEVLESLTDGFVFLDRELRYVYVNAAAEKLLWKTRDELLGRYVWDVFTQPPEAFRQGLDEAAATGRPTHVAGLNVRRGVWYDVYSNPSTEGVAILFRDVTEQKQAEETVRLSEARFRTMADAAPVLIWMSGVDQLRYYFNRGWLEFTGRSLEQETGNGWAEDVHPDDLDRYMDLYSISFSRHESFMMEYRLRRHDGMYRWIFDHGAPLFGASGEFEGYIGSCVDIHERRRTAEQMTFLTEASTLLGTSLDYEATLRNVGGLMVPRFADWYAIDLVTEEDTLEFVALAHKDPGKVKFGRELRTRYPVDMNAPTGSPKVIRTGEPEFYPVITDEMIVAAARGDEVYLDILRQIGFHSAITVPLRGRERIIGVLTLVSAESGNHYTEADLRFAEQLAARAAIAIENATLYRQARAAEADLRVLNETLEDRVRQRTDELEREVKERTHAEAALSRAVVQLEERNQELQDFAYVASHDLQEPLRKISTFADLLRDEYGASLDEEGSHYLGRIQDAARRMSSLIHDLLQYSRVSTASQRLEAVDLNEVISGVLSDLEIRLQDEQGRVAVGDLPEIQADPTQMRQLFQNLIGNALKFHRKGVPPSVAVRAEPLPGNDGAAEPKGWRIEVEDNGIGFDMKYAERIFQPFKRLHSREHYTGTGVGLAICKRIVNRHGGTIEAESTPGEGTRFVITLPERPAAPSRGSGLSHAL